MRLGGPGSLDMRRRRSWFLGQEGGLGSLYIREGVPGSPEMKAGGPVSLNMRLEGPGSLDLGGGSWFLGHEKAGGNPGSLGS